MQTDFSFLEFLAWFFLGLSFVIATIGTILPGIPGAILVAIAAIVHKLILPEVFSWLSISILVALSLISAMVDFFGGFVGAKLGGSSKAGLIGATIGSFAFFFIGFPGLIIGPFCGAILGDLYAKRKDYLALLRSGIGASLGFFISIFFRFIILIAMMIVVGIAIFL